MIREYTVTWKLTLNAKSPRAAVLETAKWLAEPGTARNSVYEVKDDQTGHTTLVDLADEAPSTA